MDQEQSLHAYQPLTTPRSIRLLRLEPGEDTDDLKGHLEHHELPLVLDDSIVYGIRKCSFFEAISYVWGEPVFNQPIYLSTGKRYLTPSLAAALRGARLPDRHRYIWADAVCIDQCMIAEKTHQVKLMGTIYMHAKRVLVWLGTDPEGVAFETFKTVKTIKTIINTSSLPQSIEDQRAALLTVATREWFTRVWIVQELRLGSCPLILWGAHHMEFKEFERRLQHVFTCRIHLDHRWILMRGLLVDIFQLMSWLRPMRCSDERDRVYAIQGLLYPSTCLSSREISLLEPDYQKSADQLFLEIACIFLNYGNAARVLSCVNRPDDTTALNSALPSWVPDWSFAVSFEPFNKENLFLRLSIPPPTTIRLSSDTRILSFEDFIGDNIASHLSPILDPSIGQSSVNKVVQFWEQHILPLKETFSASQYVHYELSLLRSILAQKGDPHPMHKDPDWRRILEAVFSPHGVTETPLHLAGKDGVSHMLESFHESLRQYTIAPFSRPTHIRSTRDYWHNRRLFLTSRGHIGLGPAAMRPTDTVAILSQVNHPAILRQEAQGWTFVGLDFIAVYDRQYLEERWGCCSKEAKYFDLK